MKKLMKVLCVILALFIAILPIMADEENTDTETSDETVSEETVSDEETEESNELGMNSPAYILVDSNSDSVLYEKESETVSGFATLSCILEIYQMRAEDGTVAGTQTERWSEGQELSVNDLRQHLFITQEDIAYQALLQVNSDLQSAVDTLQLTNTSVSDNTSTVHDISILARTYFSDSQLNGLYATTSYTPSTFGDGSAFSRDTLDMDGVSGYYMQNNGSFGFVSFECNGARLTAVVSQEENIENCKNDLITLINYAREHYKGMTITSSSIEPKVIEIDEDKSVSTITFTLNSDISLLLGADVDESSIETDILVVDDDSVDDSRAYLVIIRNGNELGRISLTKNVETVEKEVETVPVVDMICMGLAGLMVVIFVFKNGMKIFSAEE